VAGAIFDNKSLGAEAYCVRRTKTATGRCRPYIYSLRRHVHSLKLLALPFTVDSPARPVAFQAPVTSASKATRRPHNINAAVH
jgi:hypothetical protein